MTHKELESKNVAAFSKALITRIEEISFRENCSLSEWAINSGVTPSTLYDFKNQKTATLNVITIKKLCDSIKMPISEFFDTELFDAIDFDE